MIVFISGMQRSGSTFSFNIVRELLERRGTIYQEPFHDLLPVIERAGDADHVVLKAHTADDTTIRLVRLGAIKTICTVRKPEDAIASWIETFGFNLEESIERLRGWFVMFEQIRRHALIVPYALIDRHPRRAAWLIARYICPDASRIEVIRIALRYSKNNVIKISQNLQKDAPIIHDIGYSYYDEKTFFHRCHVSSLVTKPAIARIGEDAVRSIREALRAHVDPNGDIL
jgi:hypothetical protein